VAGFCRGKGWCRRDLASTHAASLGQPILRRVLPFRGACVQERQADKTDAYNYVKPAQYISCLSEQRRRCDGEQGNGDAVRSNPCRADVPGETLDRVRSVQTKCREQYEGQANEQGNGIPGPRPTGRCQDDARCDRQERVTEGPLPFAQLHDAHSSCQVLLVGRMFAQSLMAFCLSTLGLLLVLATIPWRWREDPLYVVFAVVFLALTVISLRFSVSTYRHRSG
jgi:hypothetical protein